MTEIEKMELSKMTVAIGSALCYGDIEDAKRMQKMVMDYLNASDSRRRAIYPTYRNEGDLTSGLECS